LEYNEQKDKERHVTWLELFYDPVFIVNYFSIIFLLAWKYFILWVFAIPITF